MASSRSTNTMAEFLQRIGGDIFEAKSLPDADLEFLIHLETLILQKLRAPIDQMMGQLEAGGGGSQMPGMGGEQAGMSSMPMMPPQPGGGPMPVGAGRVPGIRNEAPMPNPDEFRRMVGGS